MRDYNFRRDAKLKEQRKRKELWDRYYWPSMPRKRQDEENNKYYIEGTTGVYKRFLKRRSSKIVRRVDLGKIGNGNNYRRAFPLMWEWF